MSAVATPNPTRIEFVVAGTPIPQDRRAVPRKTRSGKAFVGTYLLPKVRDWRKLILFEARRAVGFPETPWEGPVRVTIEAFFERPDRLLKASAPPGPIRKNTKPDADNLVKSVLDALTPPRMKGGMENAAIREAYRRGYLWLDDGQVHLGPIDRWYVAKGCNPGVIVVCERIATEGEDFLC